VGLAPTGKAPPCHGARRKQTFRDRTPGSIVDPDSDIASRRSPTSDITSDGRPRHALKSSYRPTALKSSKHFTSAAGSQLRSTRGWPPRRGSSVRHFSVIAFTSALSVPRTIALVIMPAAFVFNSFSHCFSPYHGFALTMTYVVLSFPIGRL
jgi:hypothetical protein